MSFLKEREVDQSKKDRETISDSSYRDNTKMKHGQIDLPTEVEGTTREEKEEERTYELRAETRSVRRNQVLCALVLLPRVEEKNGGLRVCKKRSRSCGAQVELLSKQQGAEKSPEESSELARRGSDLDDGCQMEVEEEVQS